MPLSRRKLQRAYLDETITKQRETIARLRDLLRQVQAAPGLSAELKAQIEREVGETNKDGSLR